MKRQVLVVLLGSLFALPALAQSNVPGKTRAEVSAELIEAQRTGEIRDLGDAAGGLKLNEIWPAHYSAVQSKAAKTRDQVQAELAEAQRNGTVVVPLTDG